MVLRSLPVSFFMCDDKYNNIAKAVEKFSIQIQDADINDGGRSAYSYISKLLLYKWIKLIWYRSWSCIHEYHVYLSWCGATDFSNVLCSTDRQGNCF